MTVSSETVKLLTEIGFLAAGRGRAEDATTIFRGIAAVRPSASQCCIGLALLHLNSGRPGDAVTVLRDEGLPAVAAEDRPMVEAFLALALKMDGRPREAAEALDRIPADCADANAVALAAEIRQSL